MITTIKFHILAGKSHALFHENTNYKENLKYSMQYHIYFLEGNLSKKSSKGFMKRKDQSIHS